MSQIHHAAALSPRPLPHIPHEVLAEIAEYLDLPSAQNLSRSCKSLRDAGEMRVWRLVDITSGWDEVARLESEACKPSAPSRAERGRIVDAKLSRVFAAIRTYSPRQRYIVGVRIEPSDGERSVRCSSFVRLLREIGPQLHRLDILPLPYSYPPSAHDSLSDFAAQCHTKLHFPRLVHLKIGFGNECKSKDIILPWKMDLPLLERLEIASNDGTFMGSQHHLGPRSERRLFPHLKRLTFDGVSHQEDDLSLRLLAVLLRLAPNLAELSLRGEWRPQIKDAALRLIGRADGLRSLQLLECPDMSWVLGMEFDKFGKSGLKVKEAVVEMRTWTEPTELRFEKIKLPRAPDLQHLTICTSRRVTPEQYRALSIGPTPIDTCRIHPQLIRHLRRTPSLAAIQLMHSDDLVPSIYSVDPAIPNFFVPPQRWVTEGLRGAVIRQYTEAGGERELWHIRTLSRTLHHDYINALVSVQRHYQDFTQFDGMTVPREVLSAVYEAIGEAADFIEGGRELPLGEGDAAWSILRLWRTGAEAETEIADDVSVASAEESISAESGDESADEPSAEDEELEEEEAEEEEEEEEEEEDPEPGCDAYAYEDEYDGYDEDDPWANMGSGMDEHSQDMYAYFGLGVPGGQLDSDDGF